MTANTYDITIILQSIILLISVTDMLQFPLNVTMSCEV